MDSVQNVENVTNAEVTPVVDFDDMFVTEKDDFQIMVKYYKNNKGVFVENIDDDYDKTSGGIKELHIVFRYPTYGDYSVIQSKINFDGNKEVLVNEIMSFQYERMFILFKSWDLDHGVEKLKDMNIKIAKSIINSIHDKIGLEGIL